MAEYYFALTDINNAIDHLIHACPTTFYNGLQAARNIFSKDLAADVVPVRHGRWIEYPECLRFENAYSDDHIVCSECHEVFSILDNCTETFNYCPNCGAKMDGEA